MNIEGKKIGEENPVFIIAELSANHNGKLQKAIDTIVEAKKAGADAIKLQTYTADTITLNVKSEEFKIKGTDLWNDRYLYDLYQEAHTPWDWHEELFRIAREEGLTCFSSPFDHSAVDFLEDLNSPAYKIASFEITDIPLIEYVASKNKPVIISTGIADDSDIQLAIDTCRNAGNNDLSLLKCTSSYPASISDANLSMIPYYTQKFDVIPGLSDHSLGDTVPVVATALGAKIIEKHLIIDRNIGGPDAAFSLDKKQFKEMVLAVRNAEASMGEINPNLDEKKRGSRKFSRSLYISSDVSKGETVNPENVRSVRPGNGLHPKHLKSILGKKFKEAYSTGTPLGLDLIE